MSKNKEKFPSSPNTLHNYFARSPASTKKPANPSTPTSALAADGRLSSNNQAGGTPKSSKPTVKKESESIGKKKRTVAVKPSVEDENEDEVGTKKKRRRILMLDDSDNEDGGAADGQNNENKPNNNNNNLEDHDEQTGTKRFALLSSYERPTEQTESTDEPKGASKQESNDGPAQKKIKLENIIESNDEPGSVLDEPTVWTHQKLDFLKPNKIKDIHGNRPGSEKYDSRTLYVPDSYLGTLTPAMRQWWILKSKNYDCVLFFKVGKFYELYHMDAEVGVTELGFSFMKGEFAHSGFPEAAYDRMSTTLVEKGYKVARVEQTETPDMMQERCKAERTNSKYDKVVRREICQITVMGTEVFGQQVNITTNHQPRYMLALTEAFRQGAGSRYGVCFIDTSIGLFHLGEFDDDNQQSRLLTFLSHYPPVLVLHERAGAGNMSEGTQRILRTLLANVKREALTTGSQFWSGETTLKYLAESIYGEGSMKEGSKWPPVLRTMLDDADSLGLTPKESYQLALKALGGCVWYLQRCLLDQQVLSLATFEEYVPLDENKASHESIEKRLGAANAKRFMVLDSITLNNLKIVGSEGSLVDRMDHCCTKFGKRLLHTWICAPSCVKEEILQRQEAVGELIENVDLLQDVRQILGQLPDMERQLAQIHGFGLPLNNHPAKRAILYEEHVYGKKKMRDFIATLKGFESLLALPKLFSAVTSKLLVRVTQKADSNTSGAFPSMEKQIKFFENSFDHENALKSGSIVPEKGLDAEYDAIEQEIKDLNDELEDYLAQQSKFFGCTVKYFGNDKKRFQLEVPEARAKKATSDYSLEGTKAGKNGAKRFHTEETRHFLKQMMQLEDRRKTVLKDLARRIFERFSRDYEMWKGCIDLVGTLDVLTSLAEYARSEGLACVPELLDKDDPAYGGKSFIEIEEGVHPCLTSDAAENFIPNGIAIGGGERKANLVLLTGPNMGGKSTLMRQVGVLTIMAQIGSRIPAESCRMTLIDRIFTRLGASDDIMAGHSTFLVELNETSAILKHATADSLVLLDELGRGTATYDGTAVAGSVVHFLADLQCRTIFSTHYHNLVDSFHDDPRIALGHMACMVENEDGDDPTQETVTFLYRYTDGACPKSYGFNAAKLAGMPMAIIKRAYELSKTVEAEALKRKILMKLLKNSPQNEIKELVVKLKSCQF